MGENMHKDYIERVKESLKEAEKDESTASYLAECSTSAGIREINSRKSRYLSDLIYCTKRFIKQQENAEKREQQGRAYASIVYVPHGVRYDPTMGTYRGICKKCMNDTNMKESPEQCKYCGWTLIWQRKE